MKSAADALDDEAKAAAHEWIEWAARYAEAIDPLKQALRMPADLEPTAEAPGPFMGGWSPHRPRGW
jgi:hypothetical protein